MASRYPAEKLFERYFEEISRRIKRMKETQMESIAEAAELVAESLINDGLVHVFGTGTPSCWRRRSSTEPAGLSPSAPS